MESWDSISGYLQDNKYHNLSDENLSKLKSLVETDTQCQSIYEDWVSHYNGEKWDFGGDANLEEEHASTIQFLFGKIDIDVVLDGDEDANGKEEDGETFLTSAADDNKQEQQQLKSPKPKKKENPTVTELKLHNARLELDLEKARDDVRAAKSEVKVLEAQFEGLRNDLASMEEVNLQHMDRQVEDKETRNDVNKQVLQLKEQLETSELEKTKYKNVFSKLEATLRSEMQSFLEEKESWKAEQVTYLRKLQKEEAARKDAQKQLQTLSQTYNQLHQEHFQIAKLMSASDRQAKQALRENEKIKTDYQNLVVQYNEATGAARVKLAALEAKEGQAAAAFETQQSLESKFNMAVTNWQKADEAKKALLVEQKSLYNQLGKLNQQLDALKRENSLNAKAKEKASNSLMLLRERHAKIKNERTQLSRVHTQVLGEKQNLTRDLKDTADTLNLTVEKYVNLQMAVTNESREAAADRKQIQSLKGQVQSTHEKIAALNRKVSTLVDTKNKLTEMVALRDGEIRRLTQREKYLSKLQEKLLQSKKADQHQKLLLASVTGVSNSEVRDIVNPEEQGGAAGPDGRLWRKALKSQEGLVVKNALKRLRIDPLTVIDWFQHPNLLVLGLFSLVERMRTQSTIKLAVSNSAKTIRVNQDDGSRSKSKNKLLLQRLNAVEGLRTKAVIRFLGWLQEASSSSSSSSSADGKQESSSAAPTQLDLSGLGLEGAEVAMVNDVLADAKCAVTNVDLQENSLRDEALCKLVKSVLSASSKVTRVDFQHNRATLKGVEQVAGLVSAAAAKGDGRDGVIEGHLVEEEGQLLPMIAFTHRVGSATRQVVIDLRYNTLQQGQSRDSMKLGMSRVTRALALIERQQQSSSTSSNNNNNNNNEVDNFDEAAFNDNNAERKEGELLLDASQELETVLADTNKEMEMSNEEVERTLTASQSDDALLKRDPSKPSLQGFKMPDKHQQQAMQKSKSSTTTNKRVVTSKKNSRQNQLMSAYGR